MKKVPFLYVLFFLSISFFVCSQERKTPHLFVGIVVDQMRPDYLWRFEDQYSENGLKRLQRDGYVCQNVHIPYVPTATGPGHASIYTGTTPRYHGIVGNSWYDRKSGKEVNCVDDFSKKTITCDSTNKKAYSPHYLLSTSISDELRIAYNMKSKVVSLSYKGRSSALPAGRLANSALWFDDSTGCFVTSSFYTNSLPHWVTAFNKQKRTQKYMQNPWVPLLPNDAYSMNEPEKNFTHGLKKAVTNEYDFESLYCSPMANSLLVDLAVEAINGEQLGADNIPDLLAISFSSTDAIGHKYGPQSKELNDAFLRIDRDLARLLLALDSLVGIENYTLFLTSDHGMSDSPTLYKEASIPTGNLDPAILKTEIEGFLLQILGPGKWLSYINDNHIYLNRSLIFTQKKDLSQIQNLLSDFLKEKVGFASVFSANRLDNEEYVSNLGQIAKLGFNYKRCGDVIFFVEPGWNIDKKVEATHGSGYAYDTHIPLIWYGKGISKGISHERYSNTDIAPTISFILKTKLPSACIGNPIGEILLSK